MARITMVCADCGSDEVACDASARWSVETQQWELSGLFDNGGCDACGNSEARIIQRDLPDEDAAPPAPSNPEA